MTVLAPGCEDGTRSSFGVVRSPMSTVPVIEGWFTTGDEPALLGSRCSGCGTVFFPRLEGLCRNPACGSTEAEVVALSRRGTVWSYTDARYQPPPPYVPATEPYE